MNILTVLRPVSLICAFSGGIILATTLASSGQSRITMDNEACVGGLAGFAKLAKVDIKPATSPRKIASKCEAQDLDLKASGVVISIKQMQWNGAGFAPLVKGQLPKRLQLNLRGVTVKSAPENEPAWQYLVAEANAGRSFNASLGLSFMASTGVLTISSASLDFKNGNAASLSAQIHRVNPKFLEKPELAALAVIIDTLTFVINSGKSGRNQALDVAVAALKSNIPGKDMTKFKTRALAYIRQEMGTLLSGNALLALQNLISDLPAPKGDVVLNMQAPEGFAILRLALLKTGGNLAAALGGVDLELAYGSGKN
jgi:hypothetical protein